jgi:phenylpyruvate tautomerase PptA (4-oxalocrotonate tautomerase family)
MTNDIEQLEHGVYSLLLHIYERNKQKGFSEKAAKQEMIKSIVRVMYKITNKNDPDVLYILLPVLSPALVWLGAKVKYNNNLNELMVRLLQVYNQEQNNKES